MNTGTAFRAALVAGGLTMSLSALPAEAASSLTAYSSSATAIYSGPGTKTGNRYRVIGKMTKGEVVRLDQCTRHGYWCHIERSNGGPEGWVDASYLVGSAAKNAVTPSEFMIHFGMGGFYPFP